MAQRRVLTADERFWVKVQVAGQDECWEWQAAHTRDGYGSFWSGEYRALPYYSPVMVLAHRWSHERAGASLPDGCVVMHRCDNPPCVNPAHLETATQRINVHDCIVKGRHANGKRVLSDVEIATIKAGYRGTYGEIRVLARQYGTVPHVIGRLVKDLPKHWGRWLP